jgi:hypothetical protein
MGRVPDGSMPPTDPVGSVTTVVGRHRLPTDVIGELVSVLAEAPPIVVCDLTGMAPTVARTADLFAPVADYLADWPGTQVVVCVPDPEAYAGTVPPALADRLLVHASREAGLAEALERVTPVEHAVTHLPPVLTAARDARAFTTRALLDWRLAGLIGPAGVVVSELVTNSIVHAVTVLDLTLSRTDTCLRIAVHDHGGGSPAVNRGGQPEDMLDGRGLVLVRALTKGWGVFQSRNKGKTVWAVMDTSSLTPRPLHRSRAYS